MLAAAGVLAAAIGATSIVGSADADDPSLSFSLAATGGAPADPMYTVPELVTIVNRANALAPDVVTKGMLAARASYGSSAFSRSASVGMEAVRRGATYVQQAAPGFNYSMGVTAMNVSTVAQLMGRDLAGVLASGAVVMGRTSAELRGAQAGDQLDLVSAQGPVVSLTVGRVVDDAVIGGTEILMGTEQADAIGVATETRLLIWGFSSRELIDQQLAAVGLSSAPDVRIRHSWDRQDPDSVLVTATVKSLLGEFSYRVQSNGMDVTLDATWVAAHLPLEREILIDAIPIRARCNVAILPDLRAALTEIAAAGLGGAIDVANANLAGGCFYPRFNRITGALGFLSRHSWGAALDTNTLGNAQGATPTMDCDVVRIFRKHNFAWGGNFLTPDGMHFEWVGSPRDQYQYPSAYCPNRPVGSGTTGFAAAGSDAQSGLTTMLVDDGR